MKIDNILGAINDTAHVRINRLSASGAEVWMKLERRTVTFSCSTPIRNR